MWYFLCNREYLLTLSWHLGNLSMLFFDFQLFGGLLHAWLKNSLVSQSLSPSEGLGFLRTVPPSPPPSMLQFCAEPEAGIWAVCEKLADDCQLENCSAMLHIPFHFALSRKLMVQPLWVIMNGLHINIYHRNHLHAYNGSKDGEKVEQIHRRLGNISLKESTIVGTIYHRVRAYNTWNQAQWQIHHPEVASIENM